MVRVHTPALCMIKGLELINDEEDPVFTGTFGIIIFYRYSSPRITALRFPRSSDPKFLLTVNYCLILSNKTFLWNKR